MATPIPALIFDLDGTLVDSTDSVVEQLGALGREFGNREFTRDEIIDIVHSSGGSIHDILKIMLGETPEEVAAQIRARHGELLTQFNHLLKPYAGAIETLANLQEAGYSMAIFTSRTQWIIDGDPACKLLLPYFDAVISLEHTPRPKPHPDGVLAALAALGAKPGEALVIGDTVPDIQSGHDAGVKVAALTHGFGSRQDLVTAGADFIIDDLPSLLPILKAW